MGWLDWAVVGIKFSAVRVWVLVRVRVLVGVWI